MDPNHLSYTPQPSAHSSPTAPLGLQPVYHPPRAGHPTAYNYYGGYNTHWGLEQQQAFLVNAAQIIGGEAPAAGVTPTTHNVDFLCMWLTTSVLCTDGFANFGDLIVHLARVHDVRGNAARKLVCQWFTDQGCCGNEYRRDGFKRHIGTHVGLEVLCTECGKPFSRPDSMRAHQKKEHGKG